MKKEPVTISQQHAHSLSELVKWFKMMVHEVNMPSDPGQVRYAYGRLL